MIHPASAGEERKQSWSSGIIIFHQEKGGRPHRGSELKSSAKRSGPIFRTARTALAKPTSSSQHQGPNGSGTKAPDRNPEVGVCPSALHRKALVRSVSPHVDRRANISLSARSCGKCEELSHKCRGEGYTSESQRS